MFNLFRDDDVEKAAKIILDEIDEFDDLLKSNNNKLTGKIFEKSYKSKSGFGYQENDFKSGNFQPMAEGYYYWYNEFMFKAPRKEGKLLDNHIIFVGEGGDFNGFYGSSSGNLFRSKSSDLSKGTKLMKHLCKIKDYFEVKHDAYI